MTRDRDDLAGSASLAALKVEYDRGYCLPPPNAWAQFAAYAERSVERARRECAMETNSDRLETLQCELFDLEETLANAYAEAIAATRADLQHARAEHPLARDLHEHLEAELYRLTRLAGCGGTS